MNSRPVHLYVFDALVDWEPAYATTHINNPAFQRDPGAYVVRTVGASAQPVTTLGGMRVVPDETLDSMDPAASAMLILAGAPSWDNDASVHESVLAKAGECLAAGTPVAAICGATLGLAQAGLLDERAHTSSAAEYLASSGYAGGALYRDDDAVTDRGLITAGPAHAVSFASHIFETLGLYSEQALAAWHGFYSTGDASYFYSLASA